MNIRAFIRYEKPYMYLCTTSFLLAMAVLYVDPRNDWHWDSFAYGLSLFLLLLIGFFAVRYAQNLQVVRRRQEEDAEQLSLEAHVYHELIEELENEHIRRLNEIQDRQNDYYNYIVSWFHEIKTPIAVLRLMQQTEVDADSMEEELSRIEHYVDQSLYYAKLDSFNQDYELTNCNISPLIRELVKHHAKTFISKKIQVVLQVDSMMVQSDSKWLRFILNQLLTNSLKYTEPHGRIEVSTVQTLKEKQILIRDNGIGIEAKDLPRIFNRGFTGRHGRTYAKSTGMGLYLAQELARKLGHDLTCTSQSGHYTEMVIHFPKTHDPYRQLLTRSPKASG